MAIRVHLADDHTMFREGLAAILTSQGGDVEVVGQSFTGGDALALIERNKPDVVITQIDADLHKAKEVLSRIRSLSPNSRIVVLTIFDWNCPEMADNLSLRHRDLLHCSLLIV